MACFRLPDKQQAHKQLHTSYIFILTNSLSFFRLIHFNLSLCLSNPCHRRSLSLQSDAASRVLSSQLFVPCSLLALVVCYTTEADSTTFTPHSSWSDSSVSGESEVYCCICAILIYIVSSMKVVDLGFSSWYFLSNNGCYVPMTIFWGSAIITKCRHHNNWLSYILHTVCEHVQQSQHMPDHVLKLKPISLVVEIKCVQSYYITECTDICSHKYRCLQQVYLLV